MCHKCKVHSCKQAVAADGLCIDHLKAEAETLPDTVRLGEVEELIVAPPYRLSKRAMLFVTTPTQTEASRQRMEMQGWKMAWTNGDRERWYRPARNGNGSH